MQLQLLLQTRRAHHAHSNNLLLCPTCYWAHYNYIIFNIITTTRSSKGLGRSYHRACAVRIIIARCPDARERAAEPVFPPPPWVVSCLLLLRVLNNKLAIHARDRPHGTPNENRSSTNRPLDRASQLPRPILLGIPSDNANVKLCKLVSCYKTINYGVTSVIVNCQLCNVRSW